jgi:hypothetical protein
MGGTIDGERNVAKMPPTGCSVGSELLSMGGRSGESADQNGNGGSPTLMSARFNASGESPGDGEDGDDVDVEGEDEDDDDGEEESDEVDEADSDETTVAVGRDVGAAGRPLPSSTGNCVGVPQ